MTFQNELNLDEYYKTLLHSQTLVIHQGRPLKDYEVYPASNQIGTCFHILQDRLWKDEGIVLLEWDQIRGLHADLQFLPPRARNVASGVVACLHQGPVDPEQGGLPFFKSILQLNRRENHRKYENGNPVRLWFHIQFAEHHLNENTPGQRTGAEKQSFEALFLLRNSLTFRKCGHKLLLAETVANRIGQDAQYLFGRSIRLGLPGREAKMPFIQALHLRYPEACLEDGLTEAQVATLTAGTLHRGTEDLYRRSASFQEPLSRHMFVADRLEQVENLSMGTLSQVNTDRVKGIKLVGRNMERARLIIQEQLRDLREGDINALSNIIMAGAMGTGKTDLSILAARDAGLQAYEINSPKDQFVGQSEAKARQMFALLRQYSKDGSGIICAVDEVETILPLNRNQVNHDSGVSQALTGIFQKHLSDRSLAGRVLFIGTSNRIHEASSAMLDRWSILPVLMPLREDYPFILESLLDQLNPNAQVPEVQYILTGHLLYDQGYTIRDIWRLLKDTQKALNELPNTRHLQAIARTSISKGRNISAIHAELCALQLCISPRYLPWVDPYSMEVLSDYPFPPHLSELWDADLHRLDTIKLHQRILELAPYANI